jgi:regulator of extracellular matrix RemA (YlzA/DUF370 family)
MDWIHIGFENYLNAARVVAVVLPDSQPVRRIVQESRQRGCLIDASQGRKTRSVFITDSDHVVLSYLPPDKLLCTDACK